MVADFLIYLINKIFKGYFYTIAIFSILVTLFCLSTAKFIISKISPEILIDFNVKTFFQLSFFLFIPLFLGLILIKYKYKEMLGDKLKVKELPIAISVVLTVLLLAAGVVLFTYLLIF